MEFLPLFSKHCHYALRLFYSRYSAESTYRLDCPERFSCTACRQYLHSK
jgi:hypothetical protein